MRELGFELEQSDSSICASNYYAVCAMQRVSYSQYLVPGRLAIPVSYFLSYYQDLFLNMIVKKNLWA